MAVAREEISHRLEGYLERIGLSTLIQDFFDNLFEREELPGSPYPDLVRRFRVAESAKGLFRSIEDDANSCTEMRNTIALSPELSGVTYVQGSRGAWGMPHILQVVDSEHLEIMRGVMNAIEECLDAQGHESARHGDDYAVNVWIGLYGPTVLAGKLFRDFWADIQLTVSVEVVAKDFERAVDLFAQTILQDAKGCQGSNRLLLRQVIIDCPLGLKRAGRGHSSVWTPQELHDDSEAFISTIKDSLPLRPVITMQYLFVPPKGAMDDRKVVAPIMSVQRHYTMHFRTSKKNIVSFTNQPFGALYAGVFLGRAEAKHYGEMFRSQGMAFAVEGVAGARKSLATDVERAKEIGDTMAMHASLLPLALLSGINGDNAGAVQAAIDVARVTRSASARHRSLRHLCDSISCILRELAGWARATEPILRWEDGAVGEEELEVDENDPSNDGRWNLRRRCRSAKDLFQTWLKTTHLLFWGWRRDLLLYLDADCHSDVAVVKITVRAWIEEISSATRMGLQLPMLRWHGHSRTIAEGKDAFLDAAASIDRRLESLSGWLYCLDLSLAWDAARVCDQVHAQHVNLQRKNDVEVQAGHWPHLKGYKHGGAQDRGESTPLPTTVGLLTLQRAWMDEAVAKEHVREHEAVATHHRGRNPKRGNTTASATAAAVEAAMAKGVRYQAAPVAPDSAMAPEGVDVRLAVLETLHEDAVPEVFAHEITLMKYVIDNRIDQSLHESVNELLTSVLAPNPYPALTDALALSSTAHVLWRTVDSEDAIRPPVLTTSNKPTERSSDRDRPGKGSASKGPEGNVGIFGSRGTATSARVFGSKPALAGVDADATLILFGALPPITTWVLGGLNGDDVGVDMGIYGCAQQHGLHAHHKVPSELSVVMASTYGYDLHTGTTPMETLSRLAVHCAVTAHTTSLLVVGLTTKALSEKSLAPLSSGVRFGPDFPLHRLLSARGEVEEEIATMAPQEIILEAFMQYPLATGGEALVPLSIRFVSSPDVGQGDGCGEAPAAALLYNCVFPTANAAKDAASRHVELVESGLLERHLQLTRRLVLKSAERMNYLEAYRLLQMLRDLQLVVPDDAAGTKTRDDDDDGAEAETDSEKKRKVYSRLRGISSKSDAALSTAIFRMLKGPAGRLNHARRLLGTLRMVVSRENLAPETLASLEGRTVREHTEYCVYYLLDTLAEQSIVRFEGAVQSVKLRARLLLDHVREMVGNEGLSERAARAAGADATSKAVCKLLGSVLSILEIVELAVEVDTHRCCPQVEEILGQLRIEEMQRAQMQDAMGLKEGTTAPPKSGKGVGVTADGGGASGKSRRRGKNSIAGVTQHKDNKEEVVVRRRRNGAVLVGIPGV